MEYKLYCMQVIYIAELYRSRLYNATPPFVRRRLIVPSHINAEWASGAWPLPSRGEMARSPLTPASVALNLSDFLGLNQV